ncbi:MAG: hypothetical protein P1V51_01925 [Deltaproteobacteria bacterium]|nr:hypothetical protein [Deltaproteobacteria bacterium]
MKKAALILVALIGLAGGILYFTSDYFRAWVRRPAYMYDCKVKQGLPDSVCMAGGALKDFFGAQKKQAEKMIGD